MKIPELLDFVAIGYIDDTIVINIVSRGEQSERFIAVWGAERPTYPSSVRIIPLRIRLKYLDHIVFGIAHIRVNPELEAAFPCFLGPDAYFKTIVVHHPLVFLGSRQSTFYRQGNLRG